jgi:glucose-6-phosphate 1-epimerase
MTSAYALTPGAGGLPRLALAAPDGARAEIYLQGAHVIAWVPAGGQECLFLSRASQFRAGAPMRGGVPVAFPQFGATGPLPLHGLARLMPWEFGGARITDSQASATFRLGATEQSRRLWPHAFLIEMTVSIGGSRMELALGVTNTGATAFSFTSALHTYLSVADIGAARVDGLADLRYQDAATGWVAQYDKSPQVGFMGEVNRVYFETPSETRLIEPGRTTLIRQAGFRDTVLWNPGAAKCAAIPDLEPDDYRRFVCVEAATVGAPTHLLPGEHWQGKQWLEVTLSA